MEVILSGLQVNSIAHQVWMFQRFTVVMEYEQKPLLPPPFILFCHIFLLVKYIRRKLEGKEESYDNGLKLFLDRDEMERCRALCSVETWRL